MHINEIYNSYEGQDTLIPDKIVHKIQKDRFDITGFHLALVCNNTWEFISNDDSQRGFLLFYDPQVVNDAVPQYYLQSGCVCLAFTARTITEAYSTDEKKTLIEYGSTDDKNLVKEVYLGQEMFNDSYFKVDLTRSARYPIADDPVVDEVMHFTPSYGTSKTDDSVNSEFLSKRVDSFKPSTILITSGLRLFTGKVVLLQKNLDRNSTANPADSTRPTVLGLTDMYEYPAGNVAATQNLLEHSMQEWYGNYIIPSEIFLTPLTRQELEEYAGEHGLKRDDPNVFLQNGYLVVHFDIRTHNSADPRKDLRYSGDDPAAQNMWRDQTTKKSNDQQVTVGSPGATGHHEPKSISVNYGDVFIIDNSTSIDDWFGAHIWTMN